MERFTVTELELMRDLLIEKQHDVKLANDNETWDIVIRMIAVMNEEIIDRKCDENE